MNGILLHRAHTATSLGDALAAELSGPRDDPFAADLVVVPNPATQRWLSQHLARRAGDDGRGICAGIDFVSFDGLEDRLSRSVGLPEARWRVETLTWAFLRLLDDPAPSAALDPLRRHLGGARERITTLRRIARLFERYARWRPTMVARWLEGADVDADGRPLGFDAWQPALWRLTSRLLDVDPVADDEALLAALAAAGPGLPLPPAISVFLPTRLTPLRVRLLETLAAHRRVELWLAGPVPRSVPAANPLLGRLGREAADALLPSGSLRTIVEASPRTDTLLGRLAEDLAADRPPVGAPWDEADRSVQVHSCHGLERQVEVLRDAITDLLDRDATLQPRDVVIACADLEAASPLIQAAFGLPESVRDRHPASGFRVQVADRTGAELNPLVGVLERLLRLPTSRMEGADVLDLCAQPAVAARFGFQPSDLDRLSELVARSGIRWGLSAQQRGVFGLGSLRQNTWTAGLQRMLLGIALSEDGLPTVGTTLPLDDIDSSDVVLVGALSELVSRLSRLASEFATPATLGTWVERLRRGLEWTTDARGDDAWQQAHLWAGIGRLAERGGGEAVISLAEIESLLAAEFAETPARPPFGNGSLLVCSLASVRHLPYRVVCLLGLDEGTFPRPPAHDGDDLLLRAPRPGDPDPTLQDRQLLLDAILAAGDHLIITYQGRNAATNEAVHPSAALADLLEGIEATATRADAVPITRPARLDSAHPGVVVEHPLQPFDPAYFRGPRASFDAISLRGARALAGPRRPGEESLQVPPADAITELSLADLTAFLAHPARHFLRTRTGLSLRSADREHDEVPIEPDHLQRWEIGSRIVRLARSGQPLERIAEAEWLRGTVPPAQLGSRFVDDVRAQARQVLRLLPKATAQDAAVHDVHVDVAGVRVAGRVRLQEGRLVGVEFSRLQARHRLGAWAPLVLAAAAGVDVAGALLVGRGGSFALDAPPPEAATRALAELVALYRAGLDRPLPLTPRVGEAVAEARAMGQDPFDRDIRRLDRPWEFDSDATWLMFYPTLDALTGVPNDGPITFGHPEEPRLVTALSRTLWDPLLAQEATR